MTASNPCPKCGKSLADSAQGLCPQCLLAASLEDGGDTAAVSGPALSTAARGLLIRYVGDYEIEEELGAGGMGVVFKAQQRTLRRPVALKLLHAGALASADLVQRFRNEAEAAGALSHPNIVGIYEVGEHEGQQYFSMEWVDGPSLATKLGGRPMAARDAARLAHTLGRALQHAHQHGVLHRDIKPGNILLDELGEPHLSDFSLAQFRERALHLTQTGTPMGTPAYMSPEQARGDWKGVTTATDVWGLGAVLYEMLTGQPPFRGATAIETARQVTERDPRPPRQLNASVPPDLETICLKCLQKEPERRYATALAAGDDLERFLEGRPIQARPVRAWERGWMWARRQPAVAALWTTACLTVLAVATAVVLSRRNAARQAENNALEHLQMAQAIVLAAPPRSMDWTLRAEEDLKAASLLRDRPYYANVLAGTLQGIEAKHLGACNAPGNRQIFFEPRTETQDVRLLLAGSNAVEFWDGPKPSATKANPVRSYPGSPIAFPPGSLVQILEGEAGKLTVWDSAANRALGQIAIPDGYRLPALPARPLSALSEDQTRVALVIVSARQDNALACWELPSGRLQCAVPIRAIVDMPPSIVAGDPAGGEAALKVDATALALSPDGRFAALGVGPANPRVVVYDLLTQRPAPPLYFSHLAVRCVAFGESCRRLGSGVGADRPWLVAAGDAGGGIGIYDLGAQRLTALMRGAHLDVSQLAFCPDRMLLASGGRGQVRLWDLAMNQALLELERGDYCDALAFSADSRYLAASARAGGTNSFVHLWELSPGRGIATLRGPSGGVANPTFSPRGDRLAAVGLDWQVAVWDTDASRLLWLLEGPRGEFADNCALAFSPDARMLAISAGQEAQLWDLTTGKRLQSWPLPPGLSDALSFSSTNALYLWRAETVEEAGSPGQTSPSPRHLWETRLRNLLADRPLDVVHTIPNFSRRIIANHLSPDGKFLAVEGLRIENGKEERGLILVESPSGRVLLSLPVSTLAGYTLVRFNAASTHLAFSQDLTNWSVVELTSPNQQRAPIDPPLALGPYAGLSASADLSTQLVSLHDKRRGLHVTFPSSYLWNATFDRTGRWFAWGTQRGAVVLCDLDEMSRRFTAAGVAKPGS